jgi:hypothetical protein
MNRDEAVNRSILYKKWQKAVASLKAREELPQGLNVCLYTGTRHTTMSELKRATPRRSGKPQRHESGRLQALFPAER